MVMDYDPAWKVAMIAAALIGDGEHPSKEERWSNTSLADALDAAGRLLRMARRQANKEPYRGVEDD